MDLKSEWCAPCPPAATAAAKSLQSCTTLCDLIDGSPPGSPIPGILKARTLEWVAISFSNAWKWKVKVKSLSHVRLLVTPWTVAHQAPPSMGFSRQEYRSGVPLPSPMSSYPWLISFPSLCWGTSRTLSHAFILGSLLTQMEVYGVIHHMGECETASSVLHPHVSSWLRKTDLER